MKNSYLSKKKSTYRNTLRDDAALLGGIPLSNAALCHVEALSLFSAYKNVFAC